MRRFIVKYTFRNLTIVLFAVAVSLTATAQLPDPGMEFEEGRTALVMTDPRNDFLSPEGVVWGVV